MISCSVLTSRPPWHGFPRPWAPAQRPTIRLCKATCLPFAFIPALSQIPCKYHAIQHHLQRLRLHQPAFTPIHTHHRSTGGGRGQTMTTPGRGRGGATLEHIEYPEPRASRPAKRAKRVGSTRITEFFRKNRVVLFSCLGWCRWLSQWVNGKAT